MANTAISKIQIKSSNDTITEYLIEPTVYATTNENAATATYTANLAKFELFNGALVTVRFATTNDANATLNINSTGDKPIYYNGAKLSANKLPALHLYQLVYDTSIDTNGGWRLVGDLDTNLITGVKGNSETTYRTGNVNITKGNIGLGNVENTKLSTWAGSANITMIGTLSSGTVPWARLSDVPTASTSAAGVIKIGTTGNDSAAGNHNHDGVYAPVVEGGYLPLSGGTMTGALTLTSQSSAFNAKNIVFTNGGRIGGNTSGQIGLYGKGDIYIKPNSDTAASTTDGIVLDSDGLRPYVTDKSYTLGTSTTPWGSIYAKGYMYLYGIDQYPLDFRLYNSSKNQVAEMWYDTGNTTNVTTGIFKWRQYSPNVTASATTNGKYETYNLPSVDINLAENKAYNIITTKNLSAITATGTITSGTWKGSVIDKAYIDAAIARLASPTFTGIPKAPTAANGTSTTQIATTEFVNNTLAYANAMTFKGTLGTGGTVTALPDTHEAGDTYRVIKAGTYAGKYCEVGTLIICVKDGAAAADADWTSVETNEDGAVIGTTPTSSTDNAIVRWDGSSGRIIQNSSTVLQDDGTIKFAQVSSTSYPANSAGLSWSGDNDGASIYYSQRASNSGHLVLQTADDNNETIIFRHTKKADSNNYDGVIINPYYAQIYPAVNTQGSIGTSDYRWNNGYYNSHLYVGPTTYTAYNSDETGTYIEPGGIGLSNKTAQRGYYLRGGTTQYARLYVYTIGTASTAESSSGANDGTQGTLGNVMLELGNAIARGAKNTTNGAHNARGLIKLYGTDSAYTQIVSNLSSTTSYNFWLPNYAGEQYATHVGSTSAVGSDIQPVYVAANGRITAGQALWQKVSKKSTELYDFGVYVAQNTGDSSSPNGGNYYTILNVPYRKATGNTKADWGWQLGNVTANDGRLWYRTSGNGVWGDWQTIAHATQSATAIGGTKQPVYMAADGTITAGTALKNLAYKDSLEASDIPDISNTYLPLSGGTVTGRITKAGVSTNWNKGRDGALIAITSLSAYSTLASIKTVNGSWDIGSYTDTNYTDDLLFTYISDTHYNGSNTTDAQIRFLENGHIIAALDGTASKANLLNASSTDNTSGLQYYKGKPTIGTADGNAYEGSSNNRKLWSYPADYTAHTTVANIQTIRMYWSDAYWHDIFASPNNENLLHRSVLSGSAKNWRVILDSSNYTSYAVAKTGATMSGELTLSKANGGSNFGVYVEHTNPNSDTTKSKKVALMIGGSSGSSGLYDVSKGKWIVYSDTDGNVTLNGNALTATSASTATSSTYLTSRGRLTSANTDNTNRSRMFTFLASNTMTTGKPRDDGIITQFNWDSNYWAGQLYIPASPTGMMQYRGSGQNADTWGDWKTLLDSNNYSSYALSLSGGTMTGQIKHAGVGSNWKESRTNARLCMTAPMENNAENWGTWTPYISMRTVDGSWDLGAHKVSSTNANDLTFNFLTNTVANGTNASGPQVHFRPDITNKKVTIVADTFSGNATTATTATWATLIKPINSATTASASTWSIPSGSYQVWGERFSDTRLKYTPEGGSETTVTDTGDWTMWLTSGGTTNTATLNMRIDGTYYGSFSGNLSGNATGVSQSTSTTASYRKILLSGGDVYTAWNTSAADRTGTLYQATSISVQPSTGTILANKYIAESTDDASSTSTGTLIVNGGVGIAKKLYVGTESHFSGAIYTANNTWNQMGDDAYFGDINKAGHIGIQGKNGNTGIFFTTYNQTTKTTGAALTWDGTNMIFDKAVKLPADPQNALEAATKQYVDNSFAANDAMVYKGVLNKDATETTTSLKNVPASGYSAGWTYKVAVAGTYANVSCEVGDMVIAVTDAAANQSAVNNAHWTVVQSNLVGAVVATSGESGYIAKFSGANTITKGPKIGTSTTKWLNEKGEWSTPTAANVGAATSSHTHGNITNGGGMTATGAALADGDTLLFVDSSETNKLIKQTSIIFDGSTTTSALSKKGTWESTVTVSVAANDTSSTGKFPVMYAATNTSTTTAKNDTLKKSTGKLYFQPSTGTLTATKFSGDLSGTATNATNIRVSLNTNTKLYLLGTTSAPIDALIGVNLSACEDTGVYVTSTAGALSAVQHSYNVSGTEKAYTTYNTTDDSIDFIFI